MKKTLATESLICRYRSAPEFVLEARIIISLAFIPINALNEAVDGLVAVLSAELLSVAAWFEDNYLGEYAI